MSTAADPVVARYAENLLRQRNIAEIRSSVMSSAIDPARLQQTFETVRDDWQKAGRQAACALLDFVKRQLADILPGPEAAATEIVDADSLADAMMRENRVLRARSCLKMHRNLVTPELLARLQSKVLPEHGPAPMPQVGLFSYLVARMVADPQAQVQGLLIWSSVCQQNYRFDSALRHLRRASRLADEAGDVRSRRLAMSAEVGLYRRMGRIPEAIALMEECTRMPGAEPIELMAMLQALSSCYRQNGQTAKAIESLTQVISLAGDTYLDRKFDALNTRGLIFEDSDQYDKGAISYESAIAVAEQMRDRGRQFMAMNNRAASLLKRGLAKEGLNAFRDVLRTVERWGHPPMIASTHNNLGTALSQLERYSEARSEFAKALSSKLETGDRMGQCICFIGMGDASRSMGDLEAANAHYAMALVPALEANDASLIAMTTQRMCAKEFRTGKQIDESIESLKWARQLCREQNCNREEVFLTRDLIESYIEAGRPSEALSECRQILESGSIDPNQVGILTIMVTYARLTASEPGGWKAAFDLLSERSRRIDRALEETLVDARRGQIISSTFEAYAGLIELLAAAEANRVLTDTSPAEVAFDLHESAKCRSFLSNLATAPVNPPDAVPESLRTAEADLLRSFRALQEEGATISESYRDERLRETRESLEELWPQMKPFAQEYVRFRSGAPYSFRELSSLLPAGDGETAFVSFFVDPSRTRCFIFHSGASAPRFITLELGREELIRMASQLRRTFNGAPDEFPPYPPIRGDKPFRRKLDFLEPLETAMREFFNAVRGADLIVVAPHGPLHLIPLQILRCPDGTFLGQRSGIVYTPSLSAGLQALHRGARAPGAAGGIPIFAAGVSSADDAEPQYFENDGEIFDSERWCLTSAFGVKQATRDAVLSNLDGKAVVHLSCHGFFDSRDPLNSGLVFSDGAAKAPRNLHDLPFLERGRFLVTARELMRASLGADLVTLSACSSGLQTARNAGDEMEGFTRAILAAGSATSLVAMWNVDQASSRGLLGNFYAHLAGAGNLSSKWRALRAAQATYIESSDENLRHPYHWGPFVLIGDWR